MESWLLKCLAQSAHPTLYAVQPELAARSRGDAAELKPVQPPQQEAGAWPLLSKALLCGYCSAL